MDIPSKSVGQLDVADLTKYPVWEYTNTEEVDELQVKPVVDLPVGTLRNRVVGTQVRLHNGSERWAVLSNVSLRDPRRTRHFLVLSLERNRQWFHLARYFDADYEAAGPAQLAAFLGLPIDDVFPMTYDLSGVAVGAGEAVRGTVLREIPDKVTDRELMRMSVENEEP